MEHDDYLSQDKMERSPFRGCEGMKINTHNRKERILHYYGLHNRQLERPL